MRTAIENYCSKIGVDSDYVQGAGGNVSWKDNNTLWIKASGTWLSDAHNKDIFVPVDLEEVNHQISRGNFDIKPGLASSNSSSLRPSIETVLHAVMPHKVVSHTHLIDALIILTQKGAKEKLTSILRPSLNWGIVPYAKPGPDLGQSVHKIIQETSVDIVFLSNHGVIVGGASVEDVEQKYLALREDLHLDEPPLLLKTNFSPDLTRMEEYEIVEDAIHQGLAMDQALFSIIDDRWALYPDHVVFLGVRPAKYSSIDEFNNHLKDCSTKPDYAIIKNTAVMVKKDINKNKLVMLDLYYRVLNLTRNVENLSTLMESDITSLLNWDAEKYRQQIAK